MDWNLIVDNIKLTFNGEVLDFVSVYSVLLVTVVLSLYEFIIYRLISKKAFYSKEFNICIAVLPLFIATIIMSLQSNLVITLGTIGALAIIRFRTAVKDPVDMLYLFWAVHIGITCGCSLFPLAVITSVIVTILLLVLDHITLGRAPYLLVVRVKSLEEEEQILSIVKKYSRNLKVKSRNYKKDVVDYTIEIRTKKEKELSQALAGDARIEQFSLIAYHNENIL